MKICLMCDLHLPFDKNALQYNILDWSIEDVIKKDPDCIICAGDITCDGNAEVYNYFLERMQGINIPFLYIPGNSDLRCDASRVEIQKKASACKNDINGTLIFAINDSNGEISEEDLQIIEEADDKSIVFMHHPIDLLSVECCKKMLDWRKRHKNTMLFFAHLHKSEVTDNSVCLQALDADKAIGESPCITYYDTDTGSVRKAYYFSPVPGDLYKHFGVSCYRVLEDIKFAIENKLKNLELRPNCIDVDKDKLLECIDKWRESGGENLSVHLPDVAYINGEVSTDKRFDEYINLAERIKVDRLTQHVPRVSVSTVNEEENVLEKISEFLADKFNGIGHDIVIGIENMHMTADDTPDDNRHFGYIPGECILFMQTLAAKCRHKVGINFDIGHARNNVPYSRTYQISTWLSQIGKYIVGYHIHQVELKDGIFENHMPITDIYGQLISFASFFKCWAEERINKAPVIFEMRPEGAYQATLQTFDVYNQKNVFDIHSHTYYSNCGRDNPHDLINTAIKNGISLFGISDHNYGIGERKADYLKEIRTLAEEYKDKIKLLCGIEIATFPHLYDLKDADEIKEYDYCLIEHITEADSIVGENLFEFCDKLGIRCGIAHTDLFAYCDMYGYDYEEFFKTMAEKGIFWEMNVSYDSIHRYNEHKYVFDFINDKKKSEIVKKSNVYISVGFDSHKYEDYDGFKVHQMYDFLKKNSFNTADELFFIN